MQNIRRSPRRAIVLGVALVALVVLTGVPGAGAQIVTPGDTELFNLEHVYNFDTNEHDPRPPGTYKGSDLEFFTHTVPLRDYETGGFIDEGGTPASEPVMAKRDFAVVGSPERGGYVFDITDPDDPAFVTQVTCPQPRNDVGIKKFTDPETGETRVVLALTQQTGIPCPSEGGGVGVLVNSPGELAGFYQANQWIGTAEVNNQEADLVFAGAGCTPADYVGVDVEGKIALVSQSGDPVAGTPVSECPAATFFQKMQSAEQAGAIGLVQVRNDDVFAGRTAVTSGIPGLELRNSDGAPILEAVRGGETVNVTLTSQLGDDIPVKGTGSGGIGVFDITDPYAWEPMYRLRTGFGGVHNFSFHPTADVGYVWNGALPGVVNTIPIVDFRDLDEPVVRQGPDTLGGPHDGEISLDGSRLYVASENNYEIFDLADPFDPQLISLAANVGSYAHGVFPSPDGEIMVGNNESLVLGGFFVPGTGVCPGEGLLSYNISNEQVPIGPIGYYVPSVVGPVPDERPCTSHFGRFAPDTRVMSIGWYIAGARVVDWSNPSLPVEVAAAVLPEMNTWAAKFHKGPYLYTGDIGRGFDVFRWSGEGPAPWVAEEPEPEPGVSDLGITKSASPERRVRVGDDLTYTLEVTNEGPDDAPGVTVHDDLPDEVEFQEASASQGSCVEADGEVTCELGVLESGGSATVTIEVVVTERPRPPKITNTASVTSASDDPNADNDEDSVTTQVTGPRRPR